MAACHGGNGAIGFRGSSTPGAFLPNDRSNFDIVIASRKNILFEQIGENGRGMLVIRDCLPHHVGRRGNFIGNAATNHWQRETTNHDCCM